MTNVETLTVKTMDGKEINLYKVDYIWKFGDGYSSGNVWRTFGIYENEDVAKAVSNMIDNGEILV